MYVLKGQWDPEFRKEFYGEPYVRFLADLPSSMGTTARGVGVFLPEALMADDAGTDFVELELPPGTRIMKMVPFTITVGDPSGLPRDPTLSYEDLEVEMISVRAIPAS
jgi:hypothetical protein